MKPAIPLLTLAAILLGGSPGIQGAPDKKISEKEIKTAIDRRSEGCGSLDNIHIDHLEYFDFKRNGTLQAVVVASTCMTGTAGPDVHAVFTRDPHGKIVELPVPSPPARRIPVFGNSNYGLSVENGKLVARWIDASEREAPAVAWYRWKENKFEFDRMEIQGPFPTSYDCAKATTEMDRAICYSPSLAALDVQLGEAYRKHREQLPAEEIPALQAQQREWLARRQKECSIYKWWVDCLTGLYNERIAELK